MTRILDPTLGAAPPRVSVQAARPARLTGGTLGLLANGKTHGMTFLDRIAGALAARRGITEVLRVTKANASAPATPEQVAALTGRCTAVVTAIGD